MPAETLPATTPTRREYRVRGPLQRAPVHPGALTREILEEYVITTDACPLDEDLAACVYAV